jgi:predicted O-linked N-acetylglucosamine transferase (SPINDLY family)
VPVLTLAGRCHAARVGVSLLETVGLGPLVAADVDGYVRAAARLAGGSGGGGSGELTALRSGLRERVAGSALCDAAGFAARFEAAIRGVWRAWCEKGTRAAEG